MPKFEKTLVIIKPDAFQRNLVGEIITRFEKKGLKIVGVKMLHLDDRLLEDHYSKYKEKPFFEGLAKFMKSAPVIVMVLEGIEAVKAVRLIAGTTVGREADAGTIRGDFSMSRQANVVHISDPDENPFFEVARFFKEEELFDYKKLGLDFIYSEEERLTD